jgi:hypothetical protein
MEVDVHNDFKWMKIGFLLYFLYFQGDGALKCVN